MLGATALLVRLVREGPIVSVVVKPTVTYHLDKIQGEFAASLGFVDQVSSLVLSSMSGLASRLMAASPRHICGTQNRTANDSLELMKASVELWGDPQIGAG